MVQTAINIVREANDSSGAHLLVGLEILMLMVMMI